MPVPVLHRGLGPFPDLARLAHVHRRLADDLDRIARGEHPKADDLQEAPLLMEWKVYLAPVPHLTGIVLGHPYIPDGHICHTSELFTFDPTAGYARTLSRFYRLLPRPVQGSVQ
jgi:hypothetical protein